MIMSSGRMQMADFKMTERPLMLPDLDENGFTPLRRWREDHGVTYQDAAEKIGVSNATYFRYEAGQHINMFKANEIVEMTHGAVRYRDLIADFNPEYA
jgi:DNA-binding XRE family transcriptional regulator